MKSAFTFPALLSLLFIAVLSPSVMAAEDLPPAPSAGEKITVNDTVYGVLRTHRALQGMQENRAVLENELTRAQRFAYAPRVDAMGRAGVGKLSDPTTRNSDKDHARRLAGLSLNLTQPVMDAAAVSRAGEAKETLASVRSRVFDTASSVALDGILAHLDVLRSKAVYDAALKNVDSIKSILKQSIDRAEMGADTQADVSQARSRLARAMSGLAETKAALVVAQDTYTRLTGISFYNLVPVEDRVLDYTGPGAIFELAKQKNPALAAYLSDIRTRRAERETARAAYLPTINLEAGSNYTGRGSNNTGENYINSYDAAGVLRWNLFSSGADVAAVKAAEARVRQARKNLLDYHDEIKLSIYNAWANMKSDHDQFEFYSQAVKHNLYTRKAYWDQFRVGSRSLLDVLDSENELYNSTVQAENARVSAVANSYRLYALSGELFEVLGVDVEPLAKLPSEDAPLPGEE
jgi:adhesin transport system outer membrane protein